MAKIRFSHNSFSIGAISEKVKGNSDFDGYNNALDICENFIIQQTGGIFKRGGTKFVAETKEGEARLIMYSFSVDVQFILEFGDNYFRAYTKNGPVKNQNDEILTVETGLSIDNVRGMHTFQDGEYLILSTDKGVYEIRAIFQQGDIGFSFQDKEYTIEPSTFMNNKPVALVPNNTGEGQEETVFLLKMASDNTPAVNYRYLFNKDDEGHDLMLTYEVLDNDTNMKERRIYYFKITNVDMESDEPKVTGVLNKDKGPVGRPFLPNTEPIRRFQIGAFNETRGYPKALALYEGRLFLANNRQYPNGIWGSSTLYRDWSDFYLGAEDTDGIQYPMQTTQAESIYWMAAQSKLFIGTRWGIFVAGSATFNDEGITPSNFKVDMIDSMGAHTLQPVTALESVFFVDSSQRNVYEIFFNNNTGAFTANNLSLLAGDLTESGVICHSWQQSPVKTYWCGVKDGHMCSLTYLKNNGILAWSKHIIAGDNVKVEDMACMHGAQYDSLWLIVRRKVGNAFKRYIEILEPFFEPLRQEEFKQYYVDCGLTKEVKYKISDVKLQKLPTITYDADLDLPDTLSNGNGYWECAIPQYPRILLVRKTDEKNKVEYKYTWPYRDERIIKDEHGVDKKETVRKNRIVVPEEGAGVKRGTPLYLSIGKIISVEIDEATNVGTFKCENPALLKNGMYVVLNGTYYPKRFEDSYGNDRTPFNTTFRLVDISHMEDKVYDVDAISANSKPTGYMIGNINRDGSFNLFDVPTAPYADMDPLKFAWEDLSRPEVQLSNENHLQNIRIFVAQMNDSKEILSTGLTRSECTKVTFEGFEGSGEARDQYVYINKVPGMTELNNNEYRIWMEFRTNEFVLYSSEFKHANVPVDSDDWSPLDEIDPERGNGYMYFDKIQVPHLKGQKVQILSNGIVEERMTATGATNLIEVPEDGWITLSSPTPYCSVGLQYKARLRTTNLSGGCMLGSSIGAVGGQTCIWMYLYYSSGGRYGTSPAMLSPVPYENTMAHFNKVKNLTTGLVTCAVYNSEDVYNRSVYIEHDEPMSFNVLSITQEAYVSDN